MTTLGHMASACACAYVRTYQRRNLLTAHQLLFSQIRKRSHKRAINSEKSGRRFLLGHRRQICEKERYSVFGQTKVTFHVILGGVASLPLNFRLFCQFPLNFRLISAYFAQFPLNFHLISAYFAQFPLNFRLLCFFLVHVAFCGHTAHKTSVVARSLTRFPFFCVCVSMGSSKCL